MNKLLFFLSLIFTFTSYANDTSEYFTEEQLNASPAAQYVKSRAEEFGMSHKAFLLAKETYLRYKYEIITPDFPGILDYPEFSYPDAYSEREKQRAYNSYQAKFANFFGVPIYSLPSFLSEMESELASETIQGDKNRVVSPSSTDDK